VWDWTEDCNHGKEATDLLGSYAGAHTDGSAWISGDCNLHIRGGAWRSLPRALRSASRWRSNRSNRIDFTGFRVARTLTP
jgi:formylglycine-generating enzyme required for sulfatase activity